MKFGTNLIRRAQVKITNIIWMVVNVNLGLVDTPPPAKCLIQILYSNGNERWCQEGSGVRPKAESVRGCRGVNGESVWSWHMS